MKLPFDHSPSPALDASSAHGLHPRVRFVYLPEDGTFHDVAANNFSIWLVESYHPHVSRAVAELASECNSSSLQRRLGGFVLDVFCASLVDVADSFGVPSYIFFTSSSAMLGLMLHLQKLRDDYGKDVAEYRNSGEELAFPGFACPLQVKLLPSLVLRPETVGLFLDNYRRFRKTRGIPVNTFLELEPHPLKFLQSEPGLPKVYPVGPIVNVRGSSGDSTRRQDCHEIVKWLDRQPDASVVFLCFGSMGRFDEVQVMREIAIALEKCKCRFLWSLRRSQPKDKIGLSSDYCADLWEVLPDGFLERTAGIGRVIGWAPQAEILAHSSTGGFVSHCG
ncbi:hypothetical protein MLD38_011112 [Melastoma candidum]|uniref:Uncharacterized protein n=1 Tax=Melastoma candidum TaxID=119954 RepID=A0ACB9R658_9MYRT|nr:hypothetical protein MLD38_011112 [Melastoma candidum]